MAAKLTVEQFKEKLFKTKGDEVTLVEETYVNVGIMCIFIDKDHGRWPCKPGNVIYKKYGHPLRRSEKISKSKTIPLEKIKQNLKKNRGDGITIDESTYKNTNTKCIFIDEDYGPWPARPTDVINKRESHPKRAQQQRIKTSTLDVETIKERIKQLKGDVLIIDESTYINTKTKCRFIDKDFPNDEWWETPNNILSKNCDHPKKRAGKIAQTCFENYGVKNPQQNKEIHLKTTRSQNKHTIKHNWETGEEIDCQAGWEPLVVDHWNEDKERFRWQIPFENKEKGYVYFVDAYLPDKDIYIEIKGRKFEKGMKKWEWFHKEHPNSELWDEKKLKSLGLLKGKKNKQKVLIIPRNSQ